MGPRPEGSDVRVIVIGAGVIGLSCAVRLAERGFEVHVLARDLPLETTSAVAAALWYPYRVPAAGGAGAEGAAADGAADTAADGAADSAAADAQAARVLGWARTTYAELARLATERPETGITMTPGIELLRQPVGQPWWLAAVPADAVPSPSLQRNCRRGIATGGGSRCRWRTWAPTCRGCSAGSKTSESA